MAIVTDAFQYITSLTATGVSPNAGYVSGGTTITITGTGFVSSATVIIDDKACSDVVVVNPTTITAVSPPNTVGSKNVTISQLGLSSTIVNGFTYNINTASLLDDKPIKATYDDLLYVKDGITSILKVVQNSRGQNTPISVSDSKVYVNGELNANEVPIIFEKDGGYYTGLVNGAFGNYKNISLALMNGFILTPFHFGAKTGKSNININTAAFQSAFTFITNENRHLHIPCGGFEPFWFNRTLYVDNGTITSDTNVAMFWSAVDDFSVEGWSDRPSKAGIQIGKVLNGIMTKTLACSFQLPTLQWWDQEPDTPGSNPGYAKTVIESYSEIDDDLYPISAKDINKGMAYKIKTVGETNFMSTFGAPSNDVGTVFRASRAGTDPALSAVTGEGTVTKVIENQDVSIYFRYKIVSTGGTPTDCVTYFGAPSNAIGTEFWPIRNGTTDMIGTSKFHIMKPETMRMANNNIGVKIANKYGGDFKVHGFNGFATSMMAIATDNGSNVYGQGNECANNTFEIVRSDNQNTAIEFVAENNCYVGDSLFRANTIGTIGPYGIKFTPLNNGTGITGILCDVAVIFTRGPFAGISRYNGTNSLSLSKFDQSRIDIRVARVVLNTDSAF